MYVFLFKVASPVDSPWSQTLEGWVDEGGDKHDDDHDIHPVANEEEHEEGDDDHDHIPDHGSEEGRSLYFHVKRNTLMARKIEFKIRQLSVVPKRRPRQQMDVLYKTIYRSEWPQI